MLDPLPSGIPYTLTLTLTTSPGSNPSANHIHHRPGLPLAQHKTPLKLPRPHNPPSAHP